VTSPVASVGVLFLSAASATLGAGSLLLLLAFLLFGPLGIVDLGLDDRAALAFDAALSLLFFLQHSTMTRGGFRSRLSRRVREELQPAVYAAASGLVLVVVLLLWQETAEPLIAVTGPARWALRGLFVASLLGFAWGTQALGPFDSLGLRAIRRHQKGKPAEVPRFRVRGPYRWVRHPLYFFALVLFWAQPELTASRLLFNALWTSWVLVGTVLEERDLAALFGQPYRDYQRRVPMLVPYRLRPHH
jgi:protein-S-isoprenylcysteine O-methyltransferase Ste14